MRNYVATTSFGLEKVLAKELKNLGAQQIQELNRAVSFQASKENLYSIHLHVATALRILLPIHTFTAQNEEELYEQAMRLPWKEYMNIDTTFKVNTTAFSTVFTNSMYASLKVKDAVCDYFRKETNKRPNVDKRHPDVIFSIHIKENEIQVALDASNDSLHRRKYRLEGGMAPLNEVLAAGILRLIDWNPNQAFFDGMCGSGTMVIEALFMANQKAPGLERLEFGFLNWPDFDEQIWNKVLKEAKEAVKIDYPNILGNEIDGKIFKMAKENLVRAGFKPIHHLQNGDFFNYKPKEKEGVVFLNPPYDERIKSDDIVALYKQIGDHLKQHFTGWTAWILSGNVEARKHVGLKTAEKIKLFNGKIECRLLKYEIF